MSTARLRTALILGGGGISGAAYQIGCLAALDDYLGRDFCTGEVDIISGVSAGSIIAASLAQGIPPRRVFQAISDNEPSVMNFGRRDIYRFDSRGLLRQIRETTVRTFRALRGRWRQLTLSEFLYVLQEQLPSGVFSLAPMEEYFARSFRELRVSDRFEDLERELYIAATDLDSGEHVLFGTGRSPEVRISQALPASCAIPGFFRPYRIADRCFLDGAYGGLAHITVALERGARLLVMVNPRVPLDASRRETVIPSVSSGEPGRLADLGIGLVREQADRIHGRTKLDVGLAHLREHYPDADFLVLEPERTETVLFVQDPMAFAARGDIMHYAFQLTRRDLRRKHEVFRAAFERHGIALQQQTQAGST